MKIYKKKNNVLFGKRQWRLLFAKSIDFLRFVEFLMSDIFYVWNFWCIYFWHIWNNFIILENKWQFYLLNINFSRFHQFLGKLYKNVKNSVWVTHGEQVFLMIAFNLIKISQKLMNINMWKRCTVYSRETVPPVHYMIGLNIWWRLTNYRFPTATHSRAPNNIGYTVEPPYAEQHLRLFCSTTFIRV